MPPKAATTRTPAKPTAASEEATSAQPAPETPAETATAEVPATTGRSSTAPDLLTTAATALTVPFTLAKRLLPDDPVPVALGTGALAVAGVIEWPVAAAIGLGYVALRRWNRPRPTGGDTSEA